MSADLPERLEGYVLPVCKEAAAEIRRLRGLAGEGVLNAKTISTSSCEHGSLHINLHDEEGKVFATACFTPEIGSHLASRLVDLVERLRTCAGEAAGHA